MVKGGTIAPESMYSTMKLDKVLALMSLRGSVSDIAFR